MNRLAVVAVVTTASIARADEPRDLPAAIDIDREVAPPGRTELGFDAGADVGGWALTASLGHLEQPIVLRSTTFETLPVERRQTLALGAAIALGSSVVIDARFGFAHQTGDRLSALGSMRALDRWVPGDLRIGGRARVVHGGRGAVFVRADVGFPTGDERDFAGEPSWTLAWSLIGRATLPHGIVLAGTAGIRLRGAEVAIADRLVGDELHGGVGLVVPLPPIRPLWCAREQLALAAELVGILGDDVAGRSGPSPSEARFGVIGRPREGIVIGVRVGTGLSDAIGAPAWRATLEVTFQGRGELLPASPDDEDEVEEQLDDP